MSVLQESEEREHLKRRIFTTSVVGAVLLAGTYSVSGRHSEQVLSGSSILGASLAFVVVASLSFFIQGTNLLEESRVFVEDNILVLITTGLLTGGILMIAVDFIGRITLLVFASGFVAHITVLSGLYTLN
ncbi:hypothetical protein [Haloarchaeobius sp. FL176]|uniref:hypothetical protein n=1 Tax=Haloarchaeobius sp. FL176 TaxID=2967129 RepID=UPI002148DF87|nr:hypothetical protein [Haloarchaeobius sp. FL176]